jgi:hypothetical protein
VLDPADDHIDGWVYDLERAEPLEGQVQGSKTPGPAVEWYLDPERWDVLLATSGPDDWPRVGADGEDPPQDAVEAVTVTDVEMDTDRISFSVDEVGTPVLVRTSYFPNWEASGAEGPYRVSPNLMVVVPTENDVTLTFGRTGIDWLALVMSLTGFALVGWLAVRDQRAADEESGRPGGDGAVPGAGPDPTPEPVPDPAVT